MLRFRGFKATFNLSSNKRGNVDRFDDSPGVSLVGAYRINKDELFGNIDYPNPSKNIMSSMVMLSGSRQNISKSTNNLAQPQNGYDNVRLSAPDIPQVARESLTTTQIKEQKKLEKQRLDEEKKLEKQRLDEEKKLEKQRLDEQKKLEKQRLDEQKKLEKQRLDEQKKLENEQKKQAKLAKDQEKTEKLRENREKQTQKTKTEDKKTKKKAPQPQTQTANAQAISETVNRSEGQESTNTRGSSISTSSGPPPYTPPSDIINNNNDKSGNISFSVDESTRWDMISQHRQQINRPAVRSLPKRTHLDLNYNGAPTGATDNSNA